MLLNTNAHKKGEINTSLSGYIKFENIFGTNHHYSKIKLINGKYIKLDKGDVVKIVTDINDNEKNRKIWINTDGWITLNDIPAKSIYVNGNLIAKDTKIVKASSVLANLSSIDYKLTLNLTCKNTWVDLKIDNKSIINNYDYSGHIIVYGISPFYNGKYMILHMKTTKNIYLNSKATSVLIENLANNKNVQMIAHSISAKDINICPTSSGRNNELTIYDTNGHTYELYKQGSEKGLIDENNDIEYLDSGKSFSGSATKIILRWKGSGTIPLLIDGIEYDPTNLNGFKRMIIETNDENHPIEYVIYHRTNGAGQFYLSFNATNATITIERGHNEGLVQYILSVIDSIIKLITP